MNGEVAEAAKAAKAAKAAVADVYKRGKLAARLERHRDRTEFSYLPEYIAAGGGPLATTLAVDAEPRITPAGAVPPYFAGMLPEGRRFTALRQELKISADDEFAMLLAVGSNAVGDVEVVEHMAPLDADHQSVEVPTDLADIDFEELLRASPERSAIAGVQPKITSAMITLPATFKGRQQLLKLNPPEFPYLVENEAYFLKLAADCGLRTAKAAVIHDAGGRSALLVERFDREEDGAMLALEDGCQALDVWPADKYGVSSEEMVERMASVCAADLPAKRELFAQIVFAIVTGNGDAHAKNFSIIERDAEWRVSPAYDLPASVFYGDATMALTIDGTKRAPARRKLLTFAESLGLPARAGARTLDEILERTERMDGELAGGAIGFDVTRLNTGLKELRYRRHQLLEAV